MEIRLLESDTKEQYAREVEVFIQVSKKIVRRGPYFQRLACVDNELDRGRRVNLGRSRGGRRCGGRINRMSRLVRK